MAHQYYSPRLFTFLSMMIIFFLALLDPRTITKSQASIVMRVDPQFAGPLIMWGNFCINESGTYNQSSWYKMGLDVIASWIKSSPNIINGFYYASFGEIQAIGLCRGDATHNTCLQCLADAAEKLPQKCPTEKEAIAFYEACMFRYKNQPILHKMDISVPYCLKGYRASDVKLLNRTRARLLQTLKNQTVANAGVSSSSSSSSMPPYFAMGELNATDGDLKLYGLIQCTPDLTVSACSDCIDVAIQGLQKCSYDLGGGRVLMPSCSVRYETANFFYTQPSLPPAHSPLANTRKKTDTKSKTSKYLLIAVVLPVVAFLVLVAVLCYCSRQRRSKVPTQLTETEGDISIVDSLQFDFGTIKAATNNFSAENRLGRGGFGTVYKGKLRNGQEIAVKRLATNNSGQGEAEFKNEIVLLAKLQHRNLVRLLGFSIDKEERLLVYDFVPNASLDHFLFDSGRREYLDWEKRTKIISGLARGLLYLHEDSRLRIIHRDLKASNILLDAEMNPKIADFRLAKLFLADQTHADTSRIAGTHGYMAPEYITQGLFSVKADVYSFGVLLLEIICGRRNRDVEENTISLISLVWRSWREGSILSIIDPKLLDRDTSIGSEVTRYIHVGLLCVQENASLRPTMSSVVVMLSSDSLSLPKPSNPGFISVTLPSHECTERDQSYSQSTGTYSTSNVDSVTVLLPR